jgi:hypothetical protein
MHSLTGVNKAIEILNASPAQSDCSSMPSFTFTPVKVGTNIEEGVHGDCAAPHASEMGSSAPNIDSGSEPELGEF